MLNNPPGEMPQGDNAPDFDPLYADLTPEDTQASDTESGESGADTPVATETVQQPVRAQPESVQPAQPQQPDVDPAIVPWVQEAVTLKAEQDKRTSRLAALQNEQSAADAAAQRVYSRLAPEQQPAFEAEYWTERQRRESEYMRLNNELGAIQTNNERLGYNFRNWQRERTMEPVYAEMAADLMAKQEAAKAGDQSFPAQKLRQYLAGFPPNAMEHARDKWIAGYQASRLQARSASRVDQMGGGGTRPGNNWDNYSGADLIQMSVERLAR